VLLDDIIYNMSMPDHLVLLRHAESEGNIVTRASKNGDDKFVTDEFRDRPGSDWRLSELGVWQAGA
jgi:hypothetical protein